MRLTTPAALLLTGLLAAGTPRVGEAPLRAHLAFLAVAPQAEVDGRLLLQDALALCATPVLTLGLHEAHPWLAPLRRALRPLAYRTRIYAVNFEGSVALDGRPAQPEAAVL